MTSAIIRAWNTTRTVSANPPSLRLVPVCTLIGLLSRGYAPARDLVGSEGTTGNCAEISPRVAAAVFYLAIPCGYRQRSDLTNFSLANRHSKFEGRKAATAVQAPPPTAMGEMTTKARAIGASS